MPLQLTRQKHTILDRCGSISDWLLREFPDRKLFIYKHNKRGSLVVAEWVNKTNGLAQEWLVISERGRAQDFDSAKAGALKALLLENPVARKKDIQEGSRAMTREANKVFDQEQEEQTDYYRHARRKVRGASLKDHPMLRALAGLPA